MQDYGPPGGAPPPPPPPPPPKKKGGKGLMIVGIILLIVGILIAVVGLMPMMSAKSASDMKDDYNSEKSEFDSYSDGDMVVLSGKITNKSDAADTGMFASGYAYTLDEDFGFFASEDIGNIDDEVTVECEVKEQSTTVMGQTFKFQYLEAKSVVNPLPLIIVGIILLIVGILLMVLGIRKKKKAAAM